MIVAVGTGDGGAAAVAVAASVANTEDLRDPAPGRWAKCQEKGKGRDDNEANAAVVVVVACQYVRHSDSLSVGETVSFSLYISLSFVVSFFLSLSQSVSQSFSQLVSFSSGNVNWIALLFESGMLSVWNDLALFGEWI